MGARNWPVRLAAVVPTAVLLAAAPLSAQRIVAPADDLRGRASEATFENGRYSQAGITFEVPASWNYGGTVAAAGPADETARWTDPRSGITFYAWLSRRKAAPENIAASISAAIPGKTKQREREGYRHWRVQPGSVFPLSIGGHLALTATAEFESRGDGRPRIERLAWIFTPESRVLFFATMSPDQLAAFQPEFDTIAGSANLP